MSLQGIKIWIRQDDLRLGKCVLEFAAKQARMSEGSGGAFKLLI